LILTWYLLRLGWVVVPAPVLLPLLRKLPKKRETLTVAVVTKPFAFEGVRRMQTAEEGIANLTDIVDTLIVIPNPTLIRM
jgi:cell division protein FtsZ